MIAKAVILYSVNFINHTCKVTDYINNLVTLKRLATTLRTLVDCNIRAVKERKTSVKIRFFDALCLVCFLGSIIFENFVYVAAKLIVKHI